LRKQKEALLPNKTFGVPDGRVFWKSRRSPHDWLERNGVTGIKSLEEKGEDLP